MAAVHSPSAVTKPRSCALYKSNAFNIKTNVFRTAPPLRDADVKQIIETMARQEVRILRRHDVY